MDFQYKSKDHRVDLFRENTDISTSTTSTSNRNEPPPPYFQNEGRPQVETQNFPMYNLPLGRVTRNSTLNVFNETLGNEEHFTFYSTGVQSMGIGPPFSVQLKDAEGLPIISMTTNISRRKMCGKMGLASQTETSIKFMDASGKFLLSAKKEFGQKALAVQSDDQSHGTIEGLGFFTKSYTGKNSMGETLFQVFAGSTLAPKTRFSSSTPEFFFLAKGMNVAKLTKSSSTAENDGTKIELWISSDVEMATKSLIMTAAHLIYMNYFMKTRWGSGGLRGLANCRILTTTSIIFGTLSIIVILAILFLQVL